MLTNLLVVDGMTVREVALLSHLVDILTFFVRQHLYRSRSFVHSESLAPRVAQLLKAPQKHLKLSKTLLISQYIWVYLTILPSRVEILPHVDQPPRYLLPSPNDP